MKVTWGFILVVILFRFSCQTNKNNDSKSSKESDTTKFFQINQYLNGEIREVNATPFFIYKIELDNGRKDSLPINTSIFNQLSEQFLTPDINDEKLKPKYIESIFEDQTTKGFTINYSTGDKQLELQSVDILLGEDGKKVKRIFLRKFINYTDSAAIEQLSWKPGESFQINRSVQKLGVDENVHQTTVIWDKKK